MTLHSELTVLTQDPYKCVVSTSKSLNLRNELISHCKSNQFFYD
jgi:hypothetical protein